MMILDIEGGRELATWMQREIKGDTVESVSFHPEHGLEGMVLEIVFRRPCLPWNVAVLKFNVRDDGIKALALAHSHQKGDA